MHSKPSHLSFIETKGVQTHTLSMYIGLVRVTYQQLARVWCMESDLAEEVVMMAKTRYWFCRSSSMSANRCGFWWPQLSSGPVNQLVCQASASAVGPQPQLIVFYDVPLIKLDFFSSPSVDHLVNHRYYRRRNRSWKKISIGCRSSGEIR